VLFRAGFVTFFTNSAGNCLWFSVLAYRGTKPQAVHLRARFAVDSDFTPWREGAAVKCKFPLLIVIAMTCGCSQSRPDGIPTVSADTPDEKLADAAQKVSAKGRPQETPVQRPLDEMLRDCLPAVALVKGKCGHGAGFLLPQNVVATNAHVIKLEFEENIRVHFPSAPKGKQGPYKAKFIWADYERDLAFLEVECDVEPLELAENYTLRPGQEVIAIGSPGLGAKDFLPNAPAKGLMSNLTRIGPEKHEMPYFALSISINPGNSGGPVIDLHGQVLGMITLKAREKDGIAFAIPVDDLRFGYEHKVLAEGREAGVEMTSWLRACTVLNRLYFLGDEYSYGLDIYSQAMEMATSRGGTPNDGLRAVRKDMSDHISQTDKIFADDLEKNVNIVIKDEHLYPEDRERLEALWKCCRDMKVMIDNPSGTLDSYRFRKQQLKSRYKDLTEVKERPKKPVKKVEEKKPDDDK
jgi:hypothetical protein